MKKITLSIRQAIRYIIAEVKRRRTLLRPDEIVITHDFSSIKAALSEQTGAITVQMVTSFFIGIVLLVALIVFVLRQGGPMLIEATANTTALETAGASSEQITWVTWLGGIMFTLLIIGLFAWGARVIFGGGGGGGRKTRWRRRK